MEGAGVKKIAVVGPESTGKSVLCQQLAAYFGTAWVPEAARGYLQNLNRPYTAADVEAIARLQLEAEDEKMASAHRFLFCDTTLHVIKVWMENAFGFCPEWIDISLKTRHYDLLLLTNTDLPWEPDPLREHPNQRGFFMDWYTRLLTGSGRPFVTVSGVGEARFQSALEAVESSFGASLD